MTSRTVVWIAVTAVLLLGGAFVHRRHKEDTKALVDVVTRGTADSDAMHHEHGRPLLSCGARPPQSRTLCAHLWHAMPCCEPCCELLSCLMQGACQSARRCTCQSSLQEPRRWSCHQDAQQLGSRRLSRSQQTHRSRSLRPQSDLRASMQVEQSEALASVHSAGDVVSDTAFTCRPRPVIHDRNSPDNQFRSHGVQHPTSWADSFTTANTRCSR